MPDIDTQNVTLIRLDDQISWYDRKSMWNQAWHKRLKLVEILLAASIPIASVGISNDILTAALGTGVVVLEGIQGFYQYGNLWTSYRSTCEALKHEKYLFLANAGPYRRVSEPLVTLAERLESLVSQEHAKWVRGRHEEKDGKRDTET